MSEPFIALPPERDVEPRPLYAIAAVSNWVALTPENPSEPVAGCPAAVRRLTYSPL